MINFGKTIKMALIEHTINWYKGEVFESILTLGFGVFLIAIALVFWKVGTTQGTQAIIIPLLVVGLILSLTGGYNANTNQKKMRQIESTIFNLDDTHFLQLEKERVEGFQYLYTFTKYLATALFVISLLIFFFTENKHLQAVAIALIILGVSGLVIDYFSKERADTYYQIIIKENE